MATAQVTRGGRDVFTYGPKEIGFSDPCHIDKTAEVLREALAWVVKLQNKKAEVSAPSSGQRLRDVLHQAPSPYADLSVSHKKWLGAYRQWLKELNIVIASVDMLEPEPALKDILRKAPARPYWRAVPWAQVATWFKEYGEWLESIQPFIGSRPELTLEERIDQLELECAKLQIQLQKAVEAHDKLQTRFSQTQRGGAGARN